VFEARERITELLEVGSLREILAYPSIQSRAKFARNFIDLAINSTGTIVETLNFFVSCIQSQSEITVRVLRAAGDEKSQEE